MPDSMERENSRGPLLDHLDAIEAKCLKGDPSLQDIFDVFGPDGHYVLIVFLVIPFLQPIPFPGLSTPFGILIALVAILAYLGKPPWLPKKWARRKIAAKTVSRIAEGSEWVFEKLSFILRPRWNLFFQRPFRVINATLLVLNAALLALPLPIPLSNALPAWMIVLQAIAHLEEDGLLILFSYLQTVICLGYFFAIAKGIGTGFGALWP